MTLSIPCLLEYICPGGKHINLSQSSTRAFISDANHIDPANKSALQSIIYLLRSFDKDARTTSMPSYRKIKKPFTCPSEYVPQHKKH